MLCYIIQRRSANTKFALICFCYVLIKQKQIPLGIFYLYSHVTIRDNVKSLVPVFKKKGWVVHGLSESQP